MTEVDTVVLKRPSVALTDPLDHEQTQLTVIAQRALEFALENSALGAHPVQFVGLEDGRTIILEVHGQSSVTGHGKQGLRPERLAFLRDLEARTQYPALLIFVEGYESWRMAWLRDLPSAVPISYGRDGEPGSRRYGWHVDELDKRTGPLMLPASVPPPRERAQGALV